ncbi:MAG TPA: ribosomal protein S18-alanine N-acetyltransferase [Thermoanaerobaculia bacterium]|nr:ribosomal protein S18-alanine N-acetyltransferase [Thermoanaerobaculia bacterium]HPA50750.1 ribosomal protein S18-alanine N-acetyltransferase [Thermoanaerobaculia bacterium]HQN07446.1 ribosomal protein S18-alanine N-acetyltransferase [Thermoanaerobaculia bacterium]HQP86059.1 ribosomal protein S18-alanine N-acetyltransferase [Thermoanaerobaculia bacterium]
MSALPAELTVRDVRNVDLDAIAELERVSFPVPWKREFFAAEVGTAHRFNRVVRAPGGLLAGYVFCAFAGGEVHVNKIAVDPSCRRRGIARVLMQEVFDLSERIRAEEIYLEVRPSNVPARNFYSSLGFREVGRRPQYYADGEDALVMSLFLTPRPASP